MGEPVQIGGCHGGRYMDDVIEMRLCETEMVVLKPDRLYRFTVAPNCPRCQELARICEYEMLPNG